MEQPIDQKFEFVGRAGGSGRSATAGNDRLPMDEAKGDVRVTDVESEQHGAMIARLRPTAAGYGADDLSRGVRSGVRAGHHFPAAIPCPTGRA